jgi:hypothetical protein
MNVEVDETSHAGWPIRQDTRTFTLTDADDPCRT